MDTAVLENLLLSSAAPNWVLQPGGNVPAVDLNFAAGQYWQSGQVLSGSGLICTRGSAAYADDLSGNWTSFGNNIPRITNKGLLVEETRTNVCLWNRDLTNAAWVKTNCSAALNQMGIDGAVNSASALTASAANATCLQTTSVASSARYQSAWIKRLVGSGVVNMTMDGGTTWTAVTVTAAWTRVTIPTQTLANPVVGFRIVTSGDGIAVDFVQNENGTIFTSPILNTGAASTRAADVIRLATPPAFPVPNYTFFVAVLPPILSALTQVFLIADDQTVTNRMQFYWSGANLFAQTNPGGVNSTGPSVLTAGVASKCACRFAVNDQINAKDGVVGTGVGAVTPITGAAINTVHVGCGFNAVNQANAYLQRIALWSTVGLSNSQLQQITT